MKWFLRLFNIQSFNEACTRVVVYGNTQPLPLVIDHGQLLRQWWGI